MKVYLVWSVYAGYDKDLLKIFTQRRYAENYKILLEDRAEQLLLDAVSYTITEAQVLDDFGENGEDQDTYIICRTCKEEINEDSYTSRWIRDLRGDSESSSSRGYKPRLSDK